MMKFFVAVCLFFTLASAEYVVKTKDNMLSYREECVKELGLSADLVEQYQKWQYPNDAKTHCYLKCVFTKFGLFNNDTGFDVESIHAQLTRGAADHDDELHGKIAECVDKNEQGSNACEWAWRGADCLLKNHLQLIQQSLA
ncbi:hypothetical protein ACLKA7_011261 [Drosophila subpalustris]